jgi:Cellulase (glycosyl hydrolase family 5)
MSACNRLAARTTALASGSGPVLCRAVILLLTVSLAATTGCSSSPGLTVRVEGNRLVNAQGQTLRFLGVDLSGAEYACVQHLGIFAGPTGKQAIAEMTSWRIDSVRLPLNEDCWLGINGVPAQFGGAQYRAAIRAYVADLNSAGLYVILDLHWNAPGRKLATSQQPMADADHAPAFWSSVASTFRASPAVAFDLYNEPNGISWECWRNGCVLPAGWRAAGMQTLVNAVRSTGARQPIIASGLDSGNDLSSWLRYKPFDVASQLAAGFHAYNFLPCASVACWNHAIAPVARQVPVVATELGEVGGCSDWFIKTFMNWADPAGVSYLGWAWNPAGCGAPSLISSWDGTPTAYGMGLRAHLSKIGHSG